MTAGANGVGVLDAGGASNVPTLAGGQQPEPARARQWSAAFPTVSPRVLSGAESRLLSEMEQVSDGRCPVTGHDNSTKVAMK